MKNFLVKITFRLLLILVLCFFISYATLQKQYILAFVVGLILLQAVYSLFNYLTSLNRKMTRLFESIQYQDFAITFKADNKLGDSFKELNNGLNTVITSFNQVRAERETTLQFLQVLIHQVNVGMLSYNSDGTIEIANQAASKMLDIYRLNNIKTIELERPEVYNIIINLRSGESKLLTLNDNDLSFSVVEIRMRGRKIRLVSIHNIRSELQIRELEAWQNLTKVLRHEIMNSVTPIVSLVETMQQIVEHDLKSNSESEEETIQDLKDSLRTVERRGKGIMKFVNAYREFTSIPTPSVKSISISELLSRIEIFFQNKSRKNNINLIFELEQEFNLIIDSDQIEQVLINLIQNAIEAEYQTQIPKIIIKSKIINGQNQIAVIDNGIGISKETLDKIFIPFFTTKSTGSGIGLSLSRQIMQLHGGSLNYNENTPTGSIFILSFS